MGIKQTAKACLSLFRIRLAEAVQYRISALSGASISIFWALIEAVVYTVFFTYADPVSIKASGLTLAQMISYAWIAQFLVPLQVMSLDGEILTEITSGNVGIALCRPLGLYEHWFCKTAAGRLGGFWLRGPLTLLAGALFPAALRVAPPASLAGLFVFALSACSAFLLCAAYGMLIAAVRLGITWGEGPTYILLLFAGVLSGGYLPLQLWPDALQKALLFQPFAGYLDIPARLYIGSMPPGEGLSMILVQLLWTAGFILAGKVVMRRKLKTLVVQGG